MNAKEFILYAIASNKPFEVGLPVVDKNMVICYDDLCFQFTTALKNAGGDVIECGIELLRNEIIAYRKSGKLVINTVPELGETHAHLQFLPADLLDGVDMAIIKGIVAVAENGAIWINERQMINRLLPFICERLVVVIEKKDIVATMHHAYEAIGEFVDGFGVFISGPSKTADIEQSLIMGAHGAKELVVCFNGLSFDQFEE